MKILVRLNTKLASVSKQWIRITIIQNLIANRKKINQRLIVSAVSTNFVYLLFVDSKQCKDGFGRNEACNNSRSRSVCSLQSLSTSYLLSETNCNNYRNNDIAIQCLQKITNNAWCYSEIQWIRIIIIALSTKLLVYKQLSLVT